jgi:hypothetical protein
MLGIKDALELEGRPVAYNTIRSIIDREAPPDPSGLWQLIAFEGAGQRRADLVLPVLAAVNEKSAGRVSTLTNREADWVATIRLAVPRLNRWLCYEVARRYVAYEAQSRDTSQLDRALALAQHYWVSGEHLVEPPEQLDPDVAVLFFGDGLSFLDVADSFESEGNHETQT